MHKYSTYHQQILDALRTCKRLGIKPPRALVSCERNLCNYSRWDRKLKLAQTKLKVYKTKINAYERRTKGA